LELRTKIPKNITKLKRKKINFTLSKEEEKIYNLCDGKKDIIDVILWSSTNYFKAYSLINTLLSKDAIDYEQDTSALSQSLLNEISKVLDNMDQIPGIKTSFILDKEGKMIAKDNKKHDETGINSEMMASIFSNTVSNFENNLKSDDSSSELIEQLLVERENGEKTLLYISGKVILVAEAFKECDWGLLRLSAKRTMNSIKQLISTGA
jgi:predicted regulator of Ras-like GTPase activity (Roadblock/LC7/MglB family)